MARGLTQLAAQQLELVQTVESNRRGMAANIAERLSKLTILKATADAAKVDIDAGAVANPAKPAWAVADDAAEDVCELIDGMLAVVQTASDGLAAFDGD